MRAFVSHELRIDQRHNLSAQRLILLKAVCAKDLEPHLKIRVAAEYGWILFGAFSRTVQEPALIQIRVFYIDTRIQALDRIFGKTIVDPRTNIFAEEDPRFALRLQALAALLVEQVHQPRIRRHTDLLARLRIDTLAEHTHHICAGEFREDLRL